MSNAAANSDEEIKVENVPIPQFNFNGLGMPVNKFGVTQHPLALPLI